MKDLLIFFLFLAVIGYGFYKAYRKKSEKLFYVFLLMLFTRLSYFPLYLPLGFILALWCFLGCGALFYKWKVKKLDETLIVFSLMFLVLGIISALLSFSQINTLDSVLAFLFAK